MEMNNKVGVMEKSLEGKVASFLEGVSLWLKAVFSKGCDILDLYDDTAVPHVPAGFSVWRHNSAGIKKLDPATDLDLFLLNGQGLGKSVCGSDFLGALAGKTLANGCDLHYMINHGLVPQAWRGLSVLFLGTVYYRGRRSNQYVEALDWTGDQPGSRLVWLQSQMTGDSPVATYK